jgi:hypothetical protein
MYELTSSCVVLLEKLRVAQLIKMFLPLMELENFITVPTRSQLLTLSSARKLHSASLQSIY